MATEEPAFDLVLKEGAFEVRDYAATVVAEVRVTGTQQEAGSAGFRLLAGYIFGANTSARKIAMTVPVSKIPVGEKIAMTAPVTLQQAQSEWLVRFTMPAEYQRDDLPVPRNAAVTIKSVPPTRFAVLRFSGLAGEAKVAEQTARLLEKVSVRGLQPDGPVSIARYDPPWTPWFLRRNEVMVPLRPTRAEPV